MQKFLVKSKQEMADFAVEIAAQIESGAIATSCIALQGDLGAGKSFFARHFINFLQDEKCEVLSPTFNLVYSYETRIGSFAHFDLYRLKNQNELENIGFFEVLRSEFCLIEWPEIAAEFLPKNHLVLRISALSEELGSEDQREIIVNYGKKI